MPSINLAVAIASLIGTSIATPVRRGKSMGKSSGKSSMGMGMSSSSGGSPDARSAPVQHAYLLCTPAAPFFNNPMYCNGDVAGGFKYAVDANGDMIPTYLTRSNLGTRATVNIDRIPRGNVFSMYNVVIDEQAMAPVFVANVGGAVANRHGLSATVGLNVGTYSATGCAFPATELECPGMTAEPVQRFYAVPGGGSYKVNADTTATGYIRFVVKSHGLLSDLGDASVNNFVSQDQDFLEIAKNRFDAPECGMNADCPNWYIANFPPPSA